MMVSFMFNILQRSNSASNEKHNIILTPSLSPKLTTRTSKRILAIAVNMEFSIMIVTA